MICSQLSTQWREESLAVVARTWRGGAMWLQFVLNYSSFSPSFCRHFSPQYTRTQHTFDTAQTFVSSVSFDFTFSFLSLQRRISRSRSVHRRLRAFRRVVAVNRTITVAAAAAAARVSSILSLFRRVVVPSTSLEKLKKAVSVSNQRASNPSSALEWQGQSVRASERAGTMVAAVAGATRRTQNTDADFKYRDERLLHACFLH